MSGRLVRVLLSSLLLQATMLFEPTKAGNCESSPVDVVFVLDESGSIHGPAFDTLKKFVQNLIDRLDVKPEGARVGVETFNEIARVVVQLGETTNADQLKRLIGNIEQRRGNTETHWALKELLKMFGPQYARSEVKHLAIVITDGNSDYPDKTAIAAKHVHDAGVTVLAIGVGQLINKTELENIASDKKHVFQVDKYDDLKDILIDLDIKDCPKVTTKCPCHDEMTTKLPHSGKRLWNEFARRGRVNSVADLFD